MIMKLIPILSGLVQLALLVSAEQCARSNGSTYNLKEIVIGRCYEFINVLNVKNCDYVDRLDFDCQDIWDQYSFALVGKAPCSVGMADFDNFIAAVDHSVPRNKTLFWSGTYAIAKEITRNFGYWPLEKTLSGHLMDGLTACSKEHGLGFVESYCPRSCVYRNNPFWNAISTAYAKKASGVVTVVLNGTRKSGAFASYSTFYNYELTNLDPNQVTKVKAIILHQPGMLKYETCKAPKTLKELQIKVEGMNIEYECVDNPTEILRLMCTKVPDTNQCQLLNSMDNKSDRTSSYDKLVFFSISSLLLLLV